MPSTLLLLFLFNLSCGAEATSPPSPRFKIFWVNSYHEGYPWSDGIGQGIRKALAGKGVELEVFYMDTKRKSGEADKAAVGQAALKAMWTFEPDVVIASDDNAQKYFVVPYLKGGAMPVVFCGVNSDATRYDYPAVNVTGVVEVEPVEPLSRHLRRLAKGNRMGFLADDTEAEREVYTEFNRLAFGGKLGCMFMATMREFKDAYAEAQDNYDAVLFYNQAAIFDWRDAEALEFIRKNTRVPTASGNPWMAPFVLLTIAKDPPEQGELAVSAALRILSGAKPSDIPLAFNERASLTVNLSIAESLGLLVPMDILEAASELIGPDGTRRKNAPRQ